MPVHDIVVLAPPPLVAREGVLQHALLTAVPVMGSLGSVAFVAISGRGSAQSWVAAGMFFVASLGFVGASLWRGRSGRVADLHGRRRAYLHHLGGARELARAAGTAQRRHSTWVHPPPQALATLAAEGTRVGERRRSDDDWPVVRLGAGPQPLAVGLGRQDDTDRLTGASALADPSGPPDPVAAVARARLLETHGVVPDLPLTLPLGSLPHVEVVGAPTSTRALARAVVAQAATFHRPGALVVGVLTHPSCATEWDWVKWLPHAACRDAQGTPGAGCLVSTTLDDLAAFLPHDLEHPRRARAGAGVTGRTAGALAPAHLLLVVDGVDLPPAHALLGEDGVEGVTLLGLRRQPWSGVVVRARIEVSAAAPGRPHVVLDLGDGGAPSHGAADQLSVTGAEALARRLLSAHTADGGADGDDHSRAPVATLLGLPELSAKALDDSWRSRPPREVLRVPIGVTADGAPVHLDLKEAAHEGMGPHGLVIGATGSGKSELLRTLVLALTLTHSPETLNLVLVDFKGGATFAGMAGVPHVSAIITNLADELSLVDRMQDALLGELTRRQELLRACGNLTSARDYERRRADDQTGSLEPLPHLLIVCDEFSELLGARPELIDLFVALGRLGRSLGVHLLLASQRLEEGRLRGLESHLSYRIALRTFSAAESRSVIGVPDAHELAAVPGLGLLRSEPSALVAFSTAFVSGPEERRSHEVAGTTPETVEMVPFTAGTRQGDSPPPADEPVAGPSFFDAAVATMVGRGPVAHRVWVPPLEAPETLGRLLVDLDVDPQLGLVSRSWRSRGPLRVPLGEVDLPRRQRREVLVADLSGAHGHVAVVGAPRSGRSTVLRTLVAGLALTHTPVEVQVYLVDFGGGTLAGLQDLPHVAGLGTRADPQVVSRIVAEVIAITDAREAYFRRHHVDTIDAYRDRRRRGELDDGWGDLVLVVDGWGVLRSDFDQLDGALQALAQRSLGLGVHLVTSATRWLDYRAGLRDLLGTRIELRLGDATDSEVDRRIASTVPVGRPGRALTSAGHHALVALPRLDDDADPSTLAEGLRRLVARVARAWPGPPAPRLRLLPTTVSLDAVREAAPADPRILLGVAERTISPVGLDPARDPHLLVFGDGRSGKSGLLRTYLHEVTRLHTPETAQLFLVDFRRAQLGEFGDRWLAGYATNAASTTELVDDLAAQLVHRLPGPEVTPQQLRHRSWWQGKEAFVVVDDHELVSTGLGNPLAALLPLLPQAADIGLHLVVARRTGGAARLHDPVVTALRDLAQPGVLLSGDPGEGPLVGAWRAVRSEPGRACLVTRDGPEVIQVAWSPPLDV